MRRAPRSVVCLSRVQKFKLCPGRRCKGTFPTWTVRAAAVLESFGHTADACEVLWIPSERLSGRPHRFPGNVLILLAKPALARVRFTKVLSEELSIASLSLLILGNHKYRLRVETLEATDQMTRNYPQERW